MTRAFPWAQPLDLGFHEIADSTTFGQHDRTMLTVSYDGAMRRWSIRDTSRPTLLDSGWFEKVPDDADIDAWPNVLAVSPNGHTMALARDHGVGVELWDITDLHHAKRLGTLAAKSNSVYTTLAFSPNGRVLAAGNQLTSWLWDVSDPRHATLLHQFPKGTVGWVDQLAFSPDGRLLASLYAGEGQVTVWDVRDPRNPTHTKRTKPLNGSEYGQTMAFSPKGHLLAVGSDRGKIRFWSVSLRHSHPSRNRRHLHRSRFNPLLQSG
ncbi:WD40 repeat domain-containing protein [Streptomyces sp. NPDC001351]|uniref:WD40 repeat domain-containing protein n=1 Tax=Streptomyces sp. NPDC001351 TaxID=3364564 RepID=UPI00367B6A32